MSLLFPMFNTTVTLYNHYNDTWYATTLEDCHVLTDEAAIAATYGTQKGDTTQLHVFFETVATDELGLQTAPSGDYQITVGGKLFLPPKAWKRYPNKKDAFTFNEKDDFIAFGEIETLPSVISDESYTNGTWLGFFDYMNNKYDDVYAITSYATYRLLKHFEVMAR